MSTDFPYDGLKNVFVYASGLSAPQVRWSGKPKPQFGAQVGGQLTAGLELMVTSDINVGKDDFRQGAALPSGDLSIEQASRGWVAITCKLTQFGPTPSLNYMRRIRRVFAGSPILGDMLRALNMSIQSIPKILYEDFSIDDHAHGFTIFEVKLNWCASTDVTDEFGTGNWIENVAYNPPAEFDPF